jgi:hypothetical protein
MHEDLFAGLAATQRGIRQGPLQYDRPARLAASMARGQCLPEQRQSVI